MIKIIEPGNLDKLYKVIRFECPDCGCIFEADQRDYKSPEPMAALHDGIEAICECPFCHRDVEAYNEEQIKHFHFKERKN